MKLQNTAFVIGMIFFLNTANAQDNCRPVEKVMRGYTPVTAPDITQSGGYCLTHDLKIPRMYVFSEGGEKSATGSVMLDIRTSDVVLDLHGFVMSAEVLGMPGIRAWGEKDVPSRITIRHGSIKSRTDSAILLNAPMGSLLSDFKAMYKTQGSAERHFEKFLKSLPESASAYQKTEHRIESMKIEADTIGDGVKCEQCQSVGMDGAANIIRNSTIEITDGHAAIYLFGPNQLIENNIIIFKGKAAVESAAAIKLHQGDGTIIRNNDIIVESRDDDAPKAAISLIDSRNVIVEGNRIYGINTLVKNWDDKSNSIEKNNEFRSLFRRPLTIGEPGVH
jgi:hypothetical protein